MPMRGMDIRAVTAVGGTTAAAAFGAVAAAVGAVAAPVTAIRPSRASPVQGMPGVLAGWPVAGRTMGAGVGVGVVTTTALALWIVVVTGALPIVILVSAATAAPAGAVDSWNVMTEVVGSLGSDSLSPLQVSVSVRSAGRVMVVDGMSESTTLTWIVAVNAAFPVRPASQ